MLKCSKIHDSKVSYDIGFQFANVTTIIATVLPLSYLLMQGGEGKKAKKGQKGYMRLHTPWIHSKQPITGNKERAKHKQKFSFFINHFGQKALHEIIQKRGRHKTNRDHQKQINGKYYVTKRKHNNNRILNKIKHQKYKKLEWSNGPN